MAIIGSLTTVRDQLTATPSFKAAFAYLEKALTPGSTEHTRILAIADGQTERVELGGGLFALEQAYRSKLRSEVALESHLAHIDIQAIIGGQELIELTDVARLRVREDFTPERDLIFYEDYNAASVLRLQTGELAVFFPVDGHMPSVAAGVPVLVHKTVVKVPVTV